MVLCIVGLVVFSVLGIFSAHYRALAREAFGCVFQTITLRPCTTGFDTKMKISLTTQTSKIHPRIGKALFNHFNLFSWALVLLMLVSFY
ncbi:MAG: hypothetical protein HY917_01820, partial [Candidatus Diapherotrites archaeon]|nr:hypothetical protein [Candidatus Diapherotrites archaeon]